MSFLFWNYQLQLQMHMSDITTMTNYFWKCSDWYFLFQVPQRALLLLSQQLQEPLVVQVSELFQIVFNSKLKRSIIFNFYSRLMGSNLYRMTSPKLLFHTYCRLKLIHLLLSVSYYNSFVSVIKRLPLYKFKFKNRTNDWIRNRRKLRI